MKYIILLILLVFTGCNTNKSYTYNSYSYKKTKTNKVSYSTKKYSKYNSSKNYKSKKVKKYTPVTSTKEINSKTEAILKIDPKGHTGLIRDIIVNGDEFISASDDKTIRVIDIKTGREKRKILGEIGKGNFGAIYAIALSDDKKYLAVGGFFNSGNNERIRIYDYKSGKLLKVLKSHSNIVIDLDFCGNYLVSGGSDAKVKVWDINKNFELITTINKHTNDVYAVKIIKKYNKYYVVSAGYDNKIILYDIARKKVVKSHKLNFRLKYLAVNPKYQHIAVSGKSKTIKIYDYNLNLIKTIKTKSIAEGLAYNDSYLAVGCGSYPYNISVYRIKNYSLYKVFKKHTNVVIALDFWNNKVISGGGDNYEIYVWDIKSLKVVKKIEGVGNTIWSLGIKGNKIAWGNRYSFINYNIKGHLQKEIDLTDFSIKRVKNEKIFYQISSKNNQYSLIHSRGGIYNAKDGVLNIKKNNKVIAKISKDATNGYSHVTYGWYKDYVISGAAQGFLTIYNKQGKEISSLVGHTGDIWALAIDGDTLVSGGSDQTIRVWDLSKVGQKIIYPMLNIFVTKNNDYIIWSKSGYFASSIGGDKYVGYHINQGNYKEALFVSSDKYFDTLYRPDIIKAIWQLRSEKKALVYVGRIKKVKKVDIANSLPPVITLLSSDKIETTKNQITIKYKITSKTPILKTIITQNGRPINQRALKIKRKKGIKSVTIDLDDGLNIISIKAKNRFAFSDEVLVYVNKKVTKKDIFKPTLYILSIGVSRYKNPEFNLKVAHKDAKAFVDILKSQEGKIYKKVVSKLLVNEEATSDNIFDALDWIDKEVTSKDIAMIFIAGHGINDEKGNYYFLSYDANLNRLRRTAVKWIEIEDTIKNLPSKVILLADTCHSGNIIGTRRDITGALKSIINSGTGSIIFTATTGAGYSYEDSKWGHGAFTKAIIDGLGKFRADYDRDGVVTIKELDLYITNRVKQLTNGRQKPTTIIPGSIPDFAVGVK